MRILHVFDHSLPLQSGYVFRSLGILAAQRGFGWHTTQVTGPRHNAAKAPAETVDGWTFHRTPRLNARLAAAPIAREALEMHALARRLTELIRAERPDIVHAHSPVLVGWPALHVARRAKLPLVYEVRGLWEDAAVDLGHSRAGDLRYRATRAFETHLLRRADWVVTLCEGMRRELVGRGIPSSRINIVPNAVEPALFRTPQPKDPALVAELGLAGRIVLGFIGSFYHYEGLDLLIDALPAIRDRDPRAMLLLVGGGPMADTLRQRVSGRGLGDTVRFTGRVPHDQVQRYYDLVDFLVFPRRRMRLTELVTPLKPVEAMAERRLVIASDVGGHRELIRDGETGFLFPADDVAALARRVTEAILATDRHDRMREAARHFVAAERVWPVSAENYRAVYEGLVGRVDRRSSGHSAETDG
ncbi:MAG TPA: TIGR04063 family PEP-CTERM/XrtA system glycosyltransferase [Acetobacteraceae bacterium]|nr:TIGR04063 family PEP-CTERM/XrtA system glycosyltransferase [Acetobacteraceae bacterium]